MVSVQPGLHGQGRPPRRERVRGLQSFQGRTPPRQQHAGPFAQPMATAARKPRATQWEEPELPGQPAVVRRGDAGSGLPRERDEVPFVQAAALHRLRVRTKSWR